MNNTHDQLHLYAHRALEHMQPFYLAIEREFIVHTHDINFTVFCVAYAILLIYLVSTCTAKKAWRPKNKQLKTFKQAMKEKFYSVLLSLPLIKSYVHNKFQHQLDKQQVKIISDLQKHWDNRKVSALPADGMTDENIRKRIYEWSQNQKLIWNTGKISGAFYVENEQHMKEMNDFAAMYLYHNPLHLDTYKQLIRIEKQILDMTNTMITTSDKQYYGTITSGGSESLILALYAYRQFYKDRTSRPNIVIPVTAHAAIDKGCFYLNIEARKVKLNQKYEADVDHMESLIDGDTIMVLASIPNYPHGIIDPVDKIARLAKKKNVACHLDGCLGGFVGAFHPDFKDLYSLDREGITSISLDHHKFGLAPKGISTVFYKTPELRQSQYYVNMQWKGGLYGTMTIPGSRSGFASAAGWYSLTQVTLKGFKQNAKQIVQATIEGAKKLRSIKGIQVFGDPKLCVIAFTTTEPQCPLLALADFLSNEKKWNLSTLHKPYGIHVSVTHANAQNVIQKYPKDIEEGLKMLRSNKTAKVSLASAIYGSATKIPTEGMEHDMLKLLLGASMK